MSEKKIEITRACRVKGRGAKIGDVISVSEVDYYFLCSIGKGKDPSNKAKTEKKDK